MKHYLNVCDIKGNEVTPVDIITFGSPCQDLSVAGKRAGLKHEANGDEETTRSGLFMEAVRIIKEMRKATNGRYPTFALWENVPGAFSSNRGQDFRTVLEELAKVVDETVSIPMPPKGKWTTAGGLEGDGWSISWRTLDAQYHGVPQRRRRILLVADFRGQRAGEISFKCEGLPGYPSKSREERKETSKDLKRSSGMGYSTEGFDGYNLSATGDTSMTLTSGASDIHHIPGIVQKETEGFDSYNLTTTGKVAKTITSARTDTEHLPGIVQTVYSIQGGGETSQSSRGDGWNENVCYTLNTLDKHAVTYGFDQGATRDTGDNVNRSDTQTAYTYLDEEGITVFKPIVYENHGTDSRITELRDKCTTVCARYGTGGNNTPIVLEQKKEICGEDSKAYTMKIRSGCEGGGKEPLVQTEKSATLATNNDQYLFQPIAIGHDERSCRYTLDGKTDPLTANDYKQPISVVYDARGNGNGQIPFTKSSFSNYSEGVGTLKSSGGDLGGGSETLIVATRKK